MPAQRTRKAIKDRFQVVQRPVKKQDKGPSAAVVLVETLMAGAVSSRSGACAIPGVQGTGTNHVDMTVETEDGDTIITLTPDATGTYKGFTTRYDFYRIVRWYLDGLSERKHDKALMAQDRYDLVCGVLTEAPAALEQTDPQFRFWCRKVFELVDGPDGMVLYRGGKVCATIEQMYDIFVACHAQTCHGGRDRTDIQVKEYYSYFPKIITSSGVKVCPTCTMARSNNPEGLVQLSGDNKAAQECYDDFMDSPLKPKRARSPKTKTDKCKADKSSVEKPQPKKRNPKELKVDTLSVQPKEQLTDFNEATADELLARLAGLAGSDSITTDSNSRSTMVPTSTCMDQSSSLTYSSQPMASGQSSASSTGTISVPITPIDDGQFARYQSFMMEPNLSAQSDVFSLVCGGQDPASVANEAFDPLEAWTNTETECEEAYASQDGRIPFPHFLEEVAREQAEKQRALSAMMPIQDGFVSAVPLSMGFSR